MRGIRIPLIMIMGSKGSGMSLSAVIQGFEIRLGGKIRFYKGKYPCKILCKGKKKALVLWLCFCDVVGSKELGYKSVQIFDVDIINSMRLLHEYKS